MQSPDRMIKKIAKTLADKTKPLMSYSYGNYGHIIKSALNTVLSNIAANLGKKIMNQMSLAGTPGWPLFMQNDLLHSLCMSTWSK